MKSWIRSEGKKLFKRFPKTVLLFVISCFLLCNVNAQKHSNVTWDYRNQSFKEFAAQAERTLQIKIFYKDEWINNLKFSDDYECKDMSCILDNLFSGTTLHYFIDNKGNIIVTGNYKIQRLTDSSPDQNHLSDISDFTNLEVSDRNIDTTSITIGNPAERNLPGKVTLSGYVTNRNTKEPIVGVTVHITKLLIGAITDKSGFYTLSVPRGIHLISFSFIGMQDKKINLAIYANGSMNIEMSDMLIILNETIVSGRKNSTLERSETGVERINIESLKLLPTSLGETDIMKSLIMIPGVKSVGEGSAGFNVRGGSADQNLVLLYGTPVYSSSHLFGFFSAVNSDIIQDVTLYKGGIPARFGGRISSVLDIDTREGDRKEFRGNAGISPVTTHLMVEGPVIKDTLTYILAGRTTYSNWIFGLIKDPAVHNSRASFYDLNGGLTWYMNRKNKLELSSYTSNDNFRFVSSALYNYTNNVVALRWWHSFSDMFYFSCTVNNSIYKYDMTNIDVPAEGYILSHKINSSGLKADFNLNKGRNELNFGLDANRYAVQPGSTRPASDSSLIRYNVIQSERAYEAGLYIDDKFALTEFLSLNFGVRMSSFVSLGPKTIYTYSPDFSKSSSTVIDTLYIGAGKVTSRYGGPEFRASLNLRITDRNSIKLNYNRTRQNLHLLSNTTTISPTDTWKLCDYYLKPETGDQFAIGFYQVLFNNNLTISLEAYYKEIRNMVDFKGGSTLTMVDNIEQYLVNMKGKASGIEFSLRNTEGKFLYSLGYTYARTFIKSTGKLREDIINSGNWYPANYDRPNDLIITFNYLYSRRFTFSTDFTYNSGRPITYPLSIYHMRNIFLVQYSDRNLYRMPYNLRLDVSCKISGNLRQHKLANPNLVISVYNLFGRENPYSIYFKKEKEVLKGYILSLFGRPIPSVTFSFDF